MSIPSHGPHCTTWMYKTSCWYCTAQIAVLQCTCGSAVLFDEPEPPWPRHLCNGYGQDSNSSGGKGIGGSGISGWSAIDQLRSSGMPITPKTIQKVFGNPDEIEGNKTINPDIKAVRPRRGKSRDLIVHLMNFHQSTAVTKAAEKLSDIARQIEGLPDHQGKLFQVTMHHSLGTERHSYTALVPKSALPSKISAHLKNHSVFHAHMIATQNYWFITDLHLL